MEDCIDRDMKVINLRAKLRAIEAKRADRSNVWKLNKWLARLKYPRTSSGRRRFIQDSLKPDNKHRGKFCYYLVILIGIAGMILTLVWCLQGIDYPGAWLTSLVSMILVTIGLAGLAELKKRQS